MITRGHRYRVRKGLQLPRFCVQPLQASRLAKAAALPVTAAAVCLDPRLTNFLQLADHAHFMERFRILVPFFNSARLACAGTRHGAISPCTPLLGSIAGGVPGPLPTAIQYSRTNLA
jgi:hypothetical protein